MTQIEIKHSKYGPHRFSDSVDDVEAVLPSTPDHHGDDVKNDSLSDGRTSSPHLRVCGLLLCVLYVCDYNHCHGNRLKDQRVVVQ